MPTTTPRYAVIGAGPSGLAGLRAMQRRGLDVTGYESSPDVGGLWNIDNPRSTMYESAHLISSRTTTEFAEFPMDSTADYPSHRELRRYFDDYADHFGLRELIRFETRVDRVERTPDGGWLVHATGPDGPTTDEYTGVVIANGTLAHPNVPTFAGEFTGEILHTSAYKDAELFEGKRVLIIGAGNSGCDIAVDAVHRAASVDMSVRRGYYFVPRYLFGKPSDTLNQGRPLPARIKQAVDTPVLRAFTGDPTRYGFPKPDYKLYESHPIVNTMILNHLGQGDLSIRADIERFDGERVHFRDGTHGDYDLVMLATGYTLDYPFVDRSDLNWEGFSPKLYLNIFPPSFNGLAVLGMIEASGIGWQGRAEQAELVAAYFAADARDPLKAAKLRADAAGQWPDLTGGYKYLALERMSYYVNKDAYRRVVRRSLAAFGEAPVTGPDAPSAAADSAASDTAPATAGARA